MYDKSIISVRWPKVQKAVKITAAKKSCLEGARPVIHKTLELGCIKLQQVLGNDESKFVIFGCSRRKLVHRWLENGRGMSLQATVKQRGGSLQVCDLSTEKYSQKRVYHPTHQVDICLVPIYSAAGQELQ